MDSNVRVPVKSVALEATVIRADGSTEPLGVIAAWHRNPLKRLWLRLRRKGRVTL